MLHLSKRKSCSDNRGHFGILSKEFVDQFDDEAMKAGSLMAFFFF